jgi:hypothetical protein
VVKAEEKLIDSDPRDKYYVKEEKESNQNWICTMSMVVYVCFVPRILVILEQTLCILIIVIESLAALK